MGDEQLTAAEAADDLAQNERNWALAQARIDELAEAGKQAIQRLLQEIIERAEGRNAPPVEPEQLADVQALPEAVSYDTDDLAEAV